jgi:hypothetical protein
MIKVKSITITTCVVLSSIVMFSASALAAPAIVNSDSSLKFDDVKLQQMLTQISDKEPSLNIVFYSTNTLSPNTVLLPNGSKVNKAVYANDNFIGSIKRPNYISLYYNKDDSNPNRGSFSANVGSDFRTLITTQDISNGIVKPNIGKYLPQDPESFIPVVAEQVVVQIKAKQQQIEADIENKRLQVIKDVASKQAWDNGVKVVGFGFIIILLFIIVYYLIKTTVKHLNNSLDEYKKYKELLEQVNISYSKLVELSTYLNGYTGATGDKAEQLLILVNDVNQKYLSIKELPKFINAVLNNVTWTCFVSNLKYVDNDLTALVESIYTFLRSIEGLSGTDPLAEVIRLQKLEEETKQYNDLLVQANKSYNGGSDYVEQSRVHILFKAVQDATNLADRGAAVQAYYPIVSKEFELIKQFKQLKRSIIDVTNYITNNNNTYYTKPITSVDRAWATNLLIQASNNNDYYYLDTLKSILNELNTFALKYKQQDNQHASRTKRSSYSSSSYSSYNSSPSSYSDNNSSSYSSSSSSSSSWSSSSSDDSSWSSSSSDDSSSSSSSSDDSW